MAEEPPSPPSGIAITADHPSLRVDESALRRLLTQAAEAEEYAVDFLSVVLTNHETVRELNRTYLEHDYNTDVLAFPLDDVPSTIHGEIYVDLDTAAERHAEFDTSFEEEAFRYALHGLLHLMGYRDKSAQDRAVMRAREDRYLRRFS